MDSLRRSCHQSSWQRWLYLLRNRQLPYGFVYAGYSVCTVLALLVSFLILLTVAGYEEAHADQQVVRQSPSLRR